MVDFGPETDISASVGRRGVNRPEDVSRVKSFLNAISTELGGTDGTLIESDKSASGTDFEAMVTAIIIFQKKNFEGWFPPDGLVERQRNSHKALVRMSRRGFMPIEREIVSLIPAAGLVLDTDGRGYSRAGLTKAAAGGDWTAKTPNADPIQMLPIGGHRTLKINSTPGSTYTFALGGTKPDAAKIADTNITNITLTGLTPGEAQLHVVGYIGVVATATIRVRAQAKVRVNMVHVGRPRVPGAENNFAKLLPAISRLYEPQTNIIFEAGTTTILQKLNGVDVDPTQPVTHVENVSSQVAKLILGVQQPFSFPEMQALFPSQGNNVLTVFFSEKMVKYNKPLVLGSAQSGGGTFAWFRVGVSQTQSVSEFMVPAHEMGHLLGYSHITAPGSDTYLMNERTTFNNMRIPSDTLTDLRI